MKKMKLIGVAAATLLAISPILASSTVGAASDLKVEPISANTNTSAPYVYYNGTRYDHDATINVDNASFNNIPVGSKVDVDAIMRAFTTVKGNSVVVDTSDVDPDVAAIYPASVTISNNSGSNSITLSFNLTVGDHNANYQTIKGNPDAVATVYQQTSDGMAETSHSLDKDQQVATYGEMTIDGKKYTRLNSANSNMYVLSGWFNGAYVSNSTPTTKYLMHAAIIYDQDLKPSGKKFRQFRNIDVYADPVTMSGKQYYRVVNTLYYVNAANVDGTKRTLTKNAYIYATGSKRASKKLLKKGTTVTTYGSSFKFKNGKRYYRVGKGKQYVRTVNFK